MDEAILDAVIEIVSIPCKPASDPLLAFPAQGSSPADYTSSGSSSDVVAARNHRGGRHRTAKSPHLMLVAWLLVHGRQPLRHGDGADARLQGSRSLGARTTSWSD